jgi:hypothetical protein
MPSNSHPDAWGLMPAFMQTTPESAGKASADQQRHRERLIAQAKAESLLTDMNMPADLRDFAARMGVPELASLIWTNGFQTGWRLAHRQDDNRTTQPDLEPTQS